MPSLVEITATALRFLDERDVLSRNSFEGERATGYGNCGECSMMFASSVITSLDTTCPFLFEDGKNRVHLPLQFNIAACPFCGARKRVDAPSMFYRPSNHKVIYCVPTMGQYSEEKAEEIHGEVISALREGYKGRISPEEAEAFDAAGEEVTYSMADFIVAVQMGTTNKVWHAFITLTLADGSALIVDTTTNSMIELVNPSEIHQLWDLHETGAGHDQPGVQALQGSDSLAEAMTAYANKDNETALRLLEREHVQDPENPIVKQYLASLYLGMGKKELAAEMLRAG